MSTCPINWENKYILLPYEGSHISSKQILATYPINMTNWAITGTYTSSRQLGDSSAAVISDK